MGDVPTASAAAERANTFPWPPVIFVAVLIGAWLMTRALPLALPGMNDPTQRVIGIGFGVIGLGLIAWAVFALMSHGTTVMPDRASTALVTSGPYALLRNPIYLGELLILLSLAEIAKSSWFLVAAVAFAVLLTPLQILPEERHLEARFGDQYRSYKARTRRWI